jgi:hypothetical protein
MISVEIEKNNEKVFYSKYQEGNEIKQSEKEIV